jgi:hypothetical protein
LDDLIQLAGAAKNYRRINVDWVRRILHRNRGVLSKHNLKAANVALGAVRDENLVSLDHVLVKNGGDLLLQLRLALRIIPMRAATGASSRTDVLKTRIGGSRLSLQRLTLRSPPWSQDP